MGIKVKSSLNSEELCSIIKLCSEVKVSKLKFGTLEVEFGLTPTISPEPRIEHTSQPLPMEETRAIQEKLHVETLSKEETRTREDQLEQLIIENPLLAEELLIKGDLEDEEDGTEE